MEGTLWQKKMENRVGLVRLAIRPEKDCELLLRLDNIRAPYSIIVRS